MYIQNSLHKMHVTLVDAIFSTPQSWNIRRRSVALLWEYRLGFKSTKNTLLQFMHQLGPIQDTTDTLLSVFIATKFIGHPALSRLSELVRRLFTKIDKDNWAIMESSLLTLLLLSLYQGQTSQLSGSQIPSSIVQDIRGSSCLFTSILGNYQTVNQQILRNHISTMSQTTSILHPYAHSSLPYSTEVDHQANIELVKPKCSEAVLGSNRSLQHSTALSILQNRGENLREAILTSTHNSKGDVLLLGQITHFDDLLALIKDFGVHEQLLTYNNLSISLETRKRAKIWVHPNLYLMSLEALVDRFVDQYFGIDIAQEVANKLTDTVLFDLYLANKTTHAQNRTSEELSAVPTSLIQLQELESVHSVIHGYKDHLKACILHERFPHSVEFLDVCVVRGSIFANQQSRKMLATFYTLTSEEILRKMQQLIIAEVYRMYAGSCDQQSQNGPPEMELGIGGGIPIIRKCLFHGFTNVGPLSCKATLPALFQRTWSFTEPMKLIEELLRPIPRIWLPLSLREYAGIITELFNLGSLLSATRAFYPLLIRTLFLYTSTVAGTTIYSRTQLDTKRKEASIETLLFSSDYEFYKPKNIYTSKQGLSKQGVTHQLIQESVGSYVPRSVSFLEQEQVRRSVADQLQEHTDKLSRSVSLSTIDRNSSSNAQQESLLPGAVASQKEILAVLNDLKSYFLAEMSKLGMDITKEDVMDGLSRQFRLLLARHAPIYADLFTTMDADQYLKELDGEELVPGNPLRSSVTAREGISNIDLPEPSTNKKISKGSSAPFDESLNTQALLEKEDLLARKKMEERIEKARKWDEVRKTAIEKDKTLPLRKRKFKTAKEIIESTEYEDVGTFFDWDEYLRSEFSTLVASLYRYSGLTNRDSQSASLFAPAHQQNYVEKEWCHFVNEKEGALSLRNVDVNYRNIILQYMEPLQLLHKLTNKIICNYLLHESNLFSCIDTVGNICFLLDSNLTNRLLSTLFKHGSSTWAFDTSVQEQRMLSVLSRHELHGVAEITTLTGSLSSANVYAHNRLLMEDELSQYGREAVDYLICMNKTLNLELCATLRSRLLRLYTSLYLLCNPHSGLPIHSIIHHRDITSVLEMYSSKRSESTSYKDNGVFTSPIIQENERHAPLSHNTSSNFTILLDFSISNALFHQLYYTPLEPLFLVIFKHILALSQSLYSLHSLWFLLIVSDKDRKKYSALERRTRKLLVIRHSACCFLQIFLRFLLGDVHSTLQNAKHCIFKTLEAGANIFQSVDLWHTLLAIILARLFLTDPHRTILAAIRGMQRHVSRFCNEVRAYIEFSKAAPRVVADYEGKLTEVFWRASNAGSDLQHAIDDIVSCLTHYVEKLGVTRYEEILAQFSLLR